MGQRQAEDPLKVIFNYNNVFYSFFYDDTSGCTHRSREFAMNYVYSGEMVVDNGHERIHVGKGECVFIPRDHHITLYKRTCDGERYCGIFLMFTRAFLKEMYDKFGRREIRSAVLLVHGEKAHSRYFSEDTYKKLRGDNKELLIVPGANHTDLYDNFEKIPFDRIVMFYLQYLNK